MVDGNGESYDATYVLDVKAQDAGGKVPTAGAIGAGPLSPAVIAAILLYAIVIGMFGYVELRKRDKL